MAPASRIDELTARYAENPRRFFAPLANEHRKTGDPERAIALCRVHLPSQPGHMSGHIVLGQALLDIGELAAARSAFATAVALDDENLVALRHLGDIARLEGDAAEARAWYARVLDADPMQADVAALQAALVQETAQRETQALDADLVAADADARPLPIPTQTPFPGGLGFSEEELDAFIAHVPVRDEGVPPAVTIPVDEAVSPAVLAAVDEAVQMAHEPVGDAGDPAGTTASGGEVDSAVPVAMLDLEAIEAAGTAPVAGDDDDAALPIVDIASLAPDEADEGSESAAFEGTVAELGGAEVVHAGESAPDFEAVEVAGQREFVASGERAEAGELVQSDEVIGRVEGIEAGEDAEAAEVVEVVETVEGVEPVPSVEFVGSGEDMTSGDGSAIHESDAADEAAEPVMAAPALVPVPEVEPASGSVETALVWFEAEPEAAAVGVAPGADAVDENVEPVAGDEPSPSIAGVAAVEPMQTGASVDAVDPVEAADAVGTVGAVEAVEAVTADDALHAVAAHEARHDEPANAPDHAPADAPVDVALSSAAVDMTPGVMPRGVTPVRSAALRLLASLAPWRDGGVAGASAEAAAAGAAVGRPDADVDATLGREARESDTVAPAGMPTSSAAESIPPAASSEMDEAAARQEPATGHEASATEALVAGEAVGEEQPLAVADADDRGQAAESHSTASDQAPTAGEPDMRGGDDDPTTVPTTPVPTVARPTPAGFTTATMAELYRRQGFLAESLAVYRELAARAPDDAWYRAQVASLEAELAQGGAEIPGEVDDRNVQHGNVLPPEDETRSRVPSAASLTPPGFASLAIELADATPGVPAREAEPDWFDGGHASVADDTAPSRAAAESGDDWFGDHGESGRNDALDLPDAGDAVLFGMEDDPPMRPAMPTPVSLDALGSGLDEMFGLPVIAAADESAAQWLEALGGELTTRAVGGPLELPVPEALDVPRAGGGATAPGPLLSFDRFFGPTPPGVRRQETPAAGGAPVPPIPSLGPSFGGTPVITPRPAEPATWSLPSAEPGSGARPANATERSEERRDASPAADAPDRRTDEDRRPKSDFHRWLEGLN